MFPELKALLKQIDDATDRTEKRALIDSAMTIAGSLNDEVIEYGLHLRLFELAHDDNDYDEMENEFSWCLSRHLEDPAKFPESAAGALVGILWSYKWIVSHRLANVDCPAESILTVLDEMNHVYASNKASASGALVTRFYALTQLGRLAEAQIVWEQYQATVPDEYDNCTACVQSDLVSFALAQGNLKEARSAFIRVNRSRDSCVSEPQTAAATIMAKLAAIHSDDAVALHLRSQNSCLDSPEAFLVPLAQNIEFSAQTGNPLRALDLLTRHAQLIDATPKNHLAILAFLQAGFATCKALVVVGHSVSIDLASSLLNKYLGTDAPATAQELLPRFEFAARHLADAFDRRNGNDFVSTSVNEALTRTLPQLELGIRDFTAPIASSSNSDEIRILQLLDARDYDRALALAAQVAQASVDLFTVAQASWVIYLASGTDDDYQSFCNAFSELGEDKAGAVLEQLGPPQAPGTVDHQQLLDNLEKARVLGRSSGRLADSLAEARAAEIAYRTGWFDQAWGHLDRVVAVQQELPDHRWMITSMLQKLEWSLRVGATEVAKTTSSWLEPLPLASGAKYYLESRMAAFSDDPAVGLRHAQAAVRAAREFAPSIANLTSLQLAHQLATIQELHSEAAQYARLWLRSATDFPEIESAEMILNLGRAQLASGDEEAAIDTFRELLTQELDLDTRQETKFQLGKACLVAERPKKAVEIFTDCIQTALDVTKPENAAQLAVECATTMIDSKDYFEAKSLVQTAIDLATEHSPNRLGLAFQARGRLRCALRDHGGLKDFDLALAADPSNEDRAEILYNKSSALERLGMKDKSISAALESADLFSAVGKRDESVRSILLAVNILGEQTRFDEALILLEQAVEDDPSPTAKRVLESWITDIKNVGTE